MPRKKRALEEAKIDPLTYEQVVGPIDPAKIEIHHEKRRGGRSLVTASYLDVSGTAKNEAGAREKLEANWAERQQLEESARARLEEQRARDRANPRRR